MKLEYFIQNLGIVTLTQCPNNFHKFKMILYNGTKAYRCEHCSWTIKLRG